MKIAAKNEWLEARQVLLEKEKALTKLRAEVAAHRQNMPWRLVDEDYEFADEAGTKRISELFGDASQLVVYHYMYGPGWQEGCKSCSFWADQYDAMVPHLKARDVALAVVSRAPWQDFQAFKRRMGWQFPWFSSDGTSFNTDFHVSFPGLSEGVYNYRQTGVREEMPGVSIFVKQDNEGATNVYHTYSAYARGLDPLNATYQVLDLVPKGRDEEELAFSMQWVNFHDQYEN